MKTGFESWWQYMIIVVGKKWSPGLNPCFPECRYQGACRSVCRMGHSPAQKGRLMWTDPDCLLHMDTVREGRESSFLLPSLLKQNPDPLPWPPAQPPPNQSQAPPIPDLCPADTAAQTTYGICTHLFKPFSHFLIGLFVILLSCKSCLRMLVKALGFIFCKYFLVCGSSCATIMSTIKILPLLLRDMGPTL